MAACPRCGEENPARAKFCLSCGIPLAEPVQAREQRKIVTILFCDVTGSTQLGERLDPEALRSLLARYFEQMKAIVERHGGTVEKFIGDAVMALFGVPLVHEDDALRALRAASEMMASFPGLGIEGRIGVTTGEVVTGTAERLATGDAVNVAARLEQAASPGEILVGEQTLRLTRDAVEVEPVEPLDLKGKSDRVSAYRLIAVRPDAAAIERHLEGPMVGRTDELDLLARAYRRAMQEGACHLFTVLGSAGVGKSRLVAQFLAGVDGATVVHGRCLPYGEGITYLPVVEVINELDTAPADQAAATVIRSLLEDIEMPTSSEEIAWAFRKTLEEAAQRSPLVCVFDDIHWGEETFLDLVEHIADLSRNAPILLLCMARPELLDLRRGWGGGKVNATTILLEPLTEEETDRLIEQLTRADLALRARIRDASEGNPLFVEQMVALVQESNGGEIAVPPTIHALLAARLDQLDPFERDLLQCGAVEGRVFHGGAVSALLSEETQVSARLASLVRKELVRPGRAELPGQDAYRFRHLLIRDAAYESLPKATRAQLHERFATWLAEHGNGLADLDEILGYHLEQAHRARADLGMDDPAVADLARRAARHLASAGRRALRRGDMPSVSNLLNRASSLLEGSDPSRLELLPDLAFASFETGQQNVALDVIAEAIERGRATQAIAVEHHAKVLHGFWRLVLHARDVDLEALEAELWETIAVFERLEDSVGLARAWSLLWDTRHLRGRTDGQLEAAERAVELSYLTESPQDQAWTLSGLCWSAADGEVPAADGIRLCTKYLERTTSPVNRAILEAFLGYLCGLTADFAVAREHVARSAEVAEFGHPYHTGVVRLMWGRLEMLADDPAAAEAALRPAWEGFMKIGDDWFAPIAAVDLARAIVAQERAQEALEILATIDEESIAPDPEILVNRRAVLGRTLARLGRAEEAEAAATEAVEIASQADFLIFHGDALLDYADVLRVLGRGAEVPPLARRAAEIYTRKGAVVPAAKAMALAAAGTPA